MKKPKRKLGFGLLQALFVLFFVTLSFTGILLIISRGGANKEISTLRLKMMRVAQTAKLILSKPESYVCNPIPIVAVGSPPGTLPTQHWSCTLDNAVIGRLQVPITSAKCPSGTCSIQVSVTALPAPVVVSPPDPDNVPKVDLSVQYTGKILGSSFAANILTENVTGIKVPPEAYVGRTGVCGIDKNDDGVIDASDGYLYKGVQSNGQDLCTGFPSCEDGEVFRGFNANGSARCKILNDSLAIDPVTGKYAVNCPDDQYIKQFSFDPSSSFNTLVVDCADRIDPCDYGNTCPPL